jgi:hypothetical protein
MDAMLFAFNPHASLPFCCRVMIGLFHALPSHVCISVSDMSIPHAFPAASSLLFPFLARPPLYRDALTSVLAFLSLPELAAALSVNKEWAAAVQSMRPSMLPAAVSSHALNALLSSRLRRHVGQLGMRSGDRWLLSLRSIELPLVRALPQLQSLNVFLDELPSGAQLQFPPRLQRLQLALPDAVNAQDCAAVLTSIGRLVQLHTLQLRMKNGAVSLAPLQQLPLLRDLELDVDLGPIVEPFAIELRALPHLHRLCICAWGIGQTHHDALFTALLRDAPEEELHRLQWNDFAIDSLELTDELTPLLLRLPLLERLKVDLSGCTHFDFFSALPQLTHLELHLWHMEDVAWKELLALFTSDGLTHLHTLELWAAPCSEDDLAKLLSHTPSLISLALGEMEQVASLSFFRQLPKLAETLTHLTVERVYSWRLTAADLQSLVVLRQLRELRLIKWPNNRFESPTAEDRAPFERRPCVVLPNLEVFEWAVRRRN